MRRKEERKRKENHASPLLIILNKQFQPGTRQSVSVNPGGTIALTQANQVDREYTVFQWHERKINTLHQRPNSEVGLVTGNEGGAQFLNRVTALHDGHRRQETSQVCRGKETLISCHSSDDRSLAVLQDDMTLKETEPCRGGRTEDCCHREQGNHTRVSSNSIPPP